MSGSEQPEEGGPPGAPGTSASLDPAAPTSLSPWLLAAIFVVSTGALHAATSVPCAWTDTFNDERIVRACLDGSCSLSGVPSSQPGIVHANGWLLFRALLEAAGADLTATHLLLQASMGLAFVLLAWTAARLGGTWAAAITLTQLPFVISSLACEAVYNSALLPLVGTVQAMAAIAFAMRPSVLTALTYGAVGAVATNVHSQCATAVVSIVWIALVDGGRQRWRLAAVGLLTFAVLTFALAPAGWIDDASALLARLESHGRHAGAHPGRSPSWSDVPVVLPFVYALAIARRREDVARSVRQRLDGAVGELGPPVLAYLVLGWAGIVDADRKYLLHVTPAAAIALGVSATSAFSLAPTRWQAWLRGPLARWRAVAPWAVLVTVVPLGLGQASASPTRMLEIGDVEASADELDARGWSRTRQLAATASTEIRPLVDGWAALHPEWLATIDPDAPLDERAFLIVPSAGTPVPSALRVLPGGAVLAVVPTHLDFRRFEACVTRAGGAPATCNEASMIRNRPPEGGESACGVPGMSFAEPDVRDVTVRLSWSAPAGTDESLVMPHRAEMCAGRITEVPPGAWLAPDGRRARLVGGHAGHVTLTWSPGSPECPGSTFHGRPPFFLSGPPDDVEALTRLLPAEAR